MMMSSQYEENNIQKRELKFIDSKERERAWSEIAIYQKRMLCYWLNAVINKCDGFIMKNNKLNWHERLAE